MAIIARILLVLFYGTVGLIMFPAIAVVGLIGGAVSYLESRSGLGDGET